MSVTIFLLLVVASILSRSLSLLVSGLAYAMLSMLHLKVFGIVGGDHYGYYYASAAVFDFLAIICICISAGTLGRDWHLYPLAIVILISIVNNFFGLFVWFFDMVSDIYVWTGVGVYLLAALILAGSRFDVGRIFRANRAGTLHFIPAFCRSLLGR